MKSAKTLTATERTVLFDTLQTRFAKYPARHKGIEWPEVAKRLADAAPAKIWSLWQMEQSGGEPDVTGRSKSGELLFVDCSAETPKDRRSLCYDAQALEERKEHKPAGSTLELAQELGIELLDEAQYRALQQLGSFDTKTSSWIRTPVEIRKLGGALFCDRRYNQVFTYHNGASSYYAARGFRGLLEL
ncbi:MAG: DUF4256 domain-containing protein [Chitinophagaceae bacterium]|nr:MAG: DUF4256 domain-containing protein [Chitinophagaceae bacterium]